MSASSKKKLRHAADAAKLTERQIQEQKEAKKLNLYTTLFVAVLAVLLVIAVTVGIVNTVKGSGIRERNTVAMTVGTHEISNAELNYYYIDSVNNFLNNYGSYATMFGLDVTKPLNEQYVDEEGGVTWADDFLGGAKNSLRSTYAMVDAAAAEGFTLSDEDKAQVDLVVSNMELYASMYGFSSVDEYLKGMYGRGANLDTYKEYCYNTILADKYYSNYAAGLSYEDADLRAHEEGNFGAYSSYSYNYYYLSASKFLEGGTTDENGTVTYSDEEKAAALAAAEEAAKQLTEETVTDVETLDKVIGLLSINENAESTAKSVACDDYKAASVMGVLSDWVTDDARAEGDRTYIASTTTDKDEDGNEVVNTNGYYVVFYRGSTDNSFPLVNARHILVNFEGGTYDEATGLTVYSEEEKAAAWTEAEALMETWKSGEATEESFAALANESSDDTGSNTNGGLYEDIYPGQMVESFNDWCFADRKAGDTDLVETSFGVHLMYFVGDSDITYRDYMITNELMAADTEEWYNALVEAVTVTDGDMRYISKDLVISSN